MRVLLIIPTVSYAGTYPAYMSNSDFPVGFAYLASALKEGGHEVAGLNPNNDAGYASAREMLSARIGRSLEEIRPDLIGVGGLCTDFRFIVDAIRILRERAPGVPIVCGGGIINNDADFMFRTLRPDFCVIGEGEETLVALADMIEGGETDFDRIPNIGYWDGGEPRFTRQDFDYGDLNGRSFPDYAPFGIDEMLDEYSFAARYLYRYTRPEPRPMTIVAARSCPFRCTFCVHQRGTRYRARSVDNILEEIGYLYERYSFNILIILDELFAVDKARLREFCSALEEAKKRRGWDFDWLFQTHANANLDEATLKMAKDSGCYYFSYGLESASPKVLESMNKKISPGKISDAIDIAGKVGIGFGGNFIFGDVAETPETIVETIEFFAAKCRDIHIYFGDIKPYPGSRLFDHCVEKGMIGDRLRYYETIDAVLYNMTSMDDGTWMSMLRQVLSLASFGFVKCTNAHECRLERSRAGRPRRVLGNRSIWHVKARCPHCAREVDCREPVEDCPTGGADVVFVTGCTGCNKRIRVKIPAAAMTGEARTPQTPRSPPECSHGPREKHRTSGGSRMDVLYISLDFPEWRQARSWSYAANLGLEEGLRANDIHFMTIPAFPGMPADAATPASFLGRIRDLCSGRRFDQVWVELVHSPLDADLLDYLSTLAPVRLGLLGESLRYTPDAYAAAPHLRDRCRLVEDRLRYMTHALAVDEQDVEDCNRRKLVKAMWWVSAVPERFIDRQSGPLPTAPATFCGAVYGVRSGWLAHPSLENRLVRPPAREDATPYPGLFDKLNAAAFKALQGGTAAAESVLEEYLPRLRKIRQECFSLWLDGLRSGCAVVNLPSFLQAYAGRVVEGMAAGRPVITWAIANRPRNSALFEDGEEILLFPKDDPGVLAGHIDRLRKDRDLAGKIVLNARRRILRFHTVEKRVRQVLEWIETGCEPVYHDGADRESPRKSARHLREALRIRPDDPEVWLEVMRLGLTMKDDKTVDTAMDRAMDLCPDRGDIFTALQNISANGSDGIDRIRDLINENIYYENLFLKDPSWSSPAPNADEAARWEKIERNLRSIAGSFPGNGHPRPRILDLGCGRGWLTNLASRYGECEGIDPVSGVIKVARRHFPHIRFLHGTAETILDGPMFTPYDLLLSSEVIEHVPRTNQPRFAADLHRLLKPGGHLVLTTPRGEAYDRWKAAVHFEDQPVEEWLTEDELSRLFESRGFRAIGNDRIYVDLRTHGYVASPGSAMRESADLLGLYQVWAFQRR